MRIDADLSEFHEADGAEADYTPTELKQARFLLRRLRFLEARVREADDTDSAWMIMADLEIESLKWVLGPEGINYLAEQTTGART